MAELVTLPDCAMVALRATAPSDVLPQAGRSAQIGGDRFIWTGPDEWLIIGPDADADALLARVARSNGTDGVAIDVSGNRVAMRLTGRDADRLLAQATTLHSAAMSEGDAVSTMFARAQMIIVVIAPGLDYLLLPRRSFARYVTSWSEAATAGV